MVTVSRASVGGAYPAGDNQGWLDGCPESPGHQAELLFASAAFGSLATASPEWQTISLSLSQRFIGVDVLLTVFL